MKVTVKFDIANADFFAEDFDNLLKEVFGQVERAMQDALHRPLSTTDYRPVLGWNEDTIGFITINKDSP